MSKSKVEEMARNFAELAHTGRDGYTEYNTNRMAFIAGARAVLKEAKKIAYGSPLWIYIADLEALFKEEDHEQR